MSKFEAPSNDESLKEGFPLFDDKPEDRIENVVLGFPDYAKTIAGAIEKSPPRLTVGIFGGWGTGKTTLMLSIEHLLKKNQIKCVWFNPWRYENELRTATFPLMETILGTLISDQQVQEYFKSRDFRSESRRQKVWRVLKALSLSGRIGIPGVAGMELQVDTSKTRKRKSKKTLDDIRTFCDENRPVLQQGLDIMGELVPKIGVPGIKPESKLVVFIDDLDRCTPTKAVEVLESIKVLFEVEGIVFVLALNREVVEAAIDEKFKHLGTHFSGTYLRKIIQLPFAIPLWKEGQITRYLMSLIDRYEGEKYKEVFRQNMSLISEAAEQNPREVKRFLNSYILADQILNDDRIEPTTLLATQALLLRWSWFYDELVLDPDAIPKTQKILSGTEEEKSALKDDPLAKQLLTDDGLRKFLKGNGSVILELDSIGLKRYMIGSRDTLWDRWQKLIRRLMNPSLLKTLLGIAMPSEQRQKDSSHVTRPAEAAEQYERWLIEALKHSGGFREVMMKDDSFRERLIHDNDFREKLREAIANNPDLQEEFGLL